jgi:hypothetical protein
MQRFQFLALPPGPPQRFSIQVHPVARQSPPFQPPGQYHRLQGRRLEHGKDARESVMGRNAVGHLQEGAKERFVDSAPSRHLHKIITPR